MTVMVCIDDNGGTMFNHRRQSRDSVLRTEMLRCTDGKQLKLSPASAKQFTPEEQPQLDIRENFLETAEPGDFCFVEGSPLLPVEEKIQQLILFRWNRVYPADTHFDIPLDEHGWKLTATRDFAGSSHEKITQEVYTR